MHRLITFARDASAPVRPTPARRRHTIDEFRVHRYLAAAPSLLRVAAPAVAVVDAGSACRHTGTPPTSTARPAR